MMPSLNDMIFPDSVPKSVRRAFASAECVCSAEEVEFAVDQLAVRLTASLADRDPLFVTVLEGGAYLAGMLMARLFFPAQWATIRVSRYRNESSGGELNWHGRVMPDLTRKLVVFIDDIVDEGETLNALIQWARESDAIDVQSAVLARRTPLSPIMRPDFSALDVEPGFLVGCGLDYQQYGRNLPAIYRLNEHD